MELASDGPSSRLLREAAALAYVDSLEEPLLRPDDAYHFSVVLRLQPGEIVVASDGAGGYRGCRVTAGSGPAPRGGEARRDGPELRGGEARRDGPELRGGEARRQETAPRTGGRRARSTVIALVPDTEVVAARRPEPAITVGFSLVKPDRVDWAVAKLAELGVDRIVPLVCERTVARSGEAAAGVKRAGRVRRIAREASMVARRVWLPEVTDPLPLAEALSVLRAPAAVSFTGGPSGAGVALAEPGGAPPTLATPVVLVGPEGGWSPEELAGGLPTVRLGETILRVETAAVVAGALLTCLRSGTLAALELRRT